MHVFHNDPGIKICQAEMSKENVMLHLDDLWNNEFIKFSTNIHLTHTPVYL